MEMVVVGMEIVATGMGIVRRFMQRIGPYLLVEVLLPGGTLFALALLLYRRGRIRAGKSVPAGIPLVSAHVNPSCPSRA